MLTVKPNKIQWYSFGLTMILMGGYLFFGVLQEIYGRDAFREASWGDGVFLGLCFAMVPPSIWVIVLYSKIRLRCDGTRLIYDGAWNTHTFLFEQITQIKWPVDNKGAIVLETEIGHFTITLPWWNRRDGCFGAVILALHKAVLPEKQKNWREFCHIVEDNPDEWPRTLETPTPNLTRNEKLVTRDRYNRRLRWLLPACTIAAIACCIAIFCFRGIIVSEDKALTTGLVYVFVCFSPVLITLASSWTIPKGGKIVPTKRPVKISGLSPIFCVIGYLILFVFLLFLLPNIFDTNTPNDMTCVVLIFFTYLMGGAFFIGFYTVHYQKKAVQKQAAELPEGFIPDAFQLRKIGENDI